MKRALKIIATLVALLIITAVAIPMFVSADYIKAQLQTQVKNATGRDLVIKGKASFSVFPNIAITVSDVTLGNPAGFAGEYFVHIDRLETGAALKPLLAKELRITGVTLDGATLKLEQNAAGAKNWEFASSNATAAPQPATAKTAPASSPLNGFALGDVTLKNSSVSMVKPGAKPLKIGDIDVTIRGADGSRPLSVDGSAHYQNEPVKLALGLAQSKDFLSGKRSPITLALELPATQLHFNGSIIQKASLMAEGALELDVADMNALLGWATGKPSAGMPKHVALKTGLYMQNEKAFALKEATIAVDALKATGSLAIDMAGAVPAVKGNLALAKLDVDALGAHGGNAAHGAAPAKAAAKQDGWSDAPLDMSALRAANVNLGVVITSLSSGALELSNIAGDVVTSNGVGKLVLTHLALYGGTAKGTVTVDGSGAGAGLTTNLTLAGIQIEPLMTALSGDSKLKGTANLALNVAGRGASQRALVSSLSGNGSANVTDGAIKGINIASFLRDAKKGFILGDGSTEATDFTELTASYTISNGILSNDDLLMKSPILRLTGSGTVNLPARSVAYRAVPTIVGTLKGQGGKDKLSSGGLDIPLIISGPWSAISVTPDLAGMVQGALKDPAALKQNLKDISGTIGKFNSPKDIGKALFGGTKAPEAAPAPALQPVAPAATAAPSSAPVAPAAPAAEAAPAKKQKLDIGSLINTLAK